MGKVYLIEIICERKTFPQHPLAKRMLRKRELMMKMRD